MVTTVRIFSGHCAKLRKFVDSSNLQLAEEPAGVAEVELLLAALLVLLTDAEAARDDEDQRRVLETVLLHDPEALGDVPDLHLAKQDRLRLQLQLILEGAQGELHHLLSLGQAAPPTDGKYFLTN